MNILINLTMERQSPSGSGSLHSNTVANPRGNVKAITTRSGVAYDGHTIPPTPSPFPKVVECETEATKDKVQAIITQIDTFYNGLTLRHRDTINAAAGGTFMQKTPKECYELIENMTAHHNHWDTSATRDETSRNISSTTTESLEVVQQLEMINKNFLDMMRKIQSVKSVNTKCETCGGPHSYTECPAVDGYTQEAAYATT
nr:reverse transcriptase domain-containing protein [Tanacetum cinerariifolium]